jgi:FkbM family methyltransferase
VNFSSLSSKSFLGYALRFPLRLIPRNMVLPIIQGPLRGKRWIASASNHGCWLGSYEYDKQRLVTELITRSQVVYDIGANVGYYTLLFSHLVGPSGRVMAFEPEPKNFAILKRHLVLNQCRNVTSIESAIGNQCGTVRFQVGPTNAMGKVSTYGELNVAIQILDEWIVQNNAPGPDCIKIDVEGAESDVLIGARQTLERYHPVIFLATHSKVLHEWCISYLLELGYCLYPVAGEDINQTDELLAVWTKQIVPEEIAGLV